MLFPAASLSGEPAAEKAAATTAKAAAEVAAKATIVVGLYEHKAAGIPLRQASCWLCQDTQLFAEKDPTLQDVALEEALLVLSTNSSGANSCGQHSFFLASLSNQTLNPKHLPQAAATRHFGSGRVWFGLRDDGGSELAEKHDGSSLISIRPELMPLLVIDV